VGVGVPGLGALLLLAQLLPTLHLVVVVAGVGREEGPEGLEEVPERFGVVVEAGRETGIHVARGRVVRDVEPPGIAGHRLPAVGREDAADVDDVEASGGTKLEGLERGIVGHGI